MNGRIPAVISGFPTAMEMRIATPIVELTAPSCASMTRGFPLQKLIATLATLTTSTSTAMLLTTRPLTRSSTACAAGAALLTASDVTTSQPALRSR